MQVSRFINTLAELVLQLMKTWPGVWGLSGGVFQNRPLTEQILAWAAREQLTVFIHQRVPPNDGGISLGQAFYGGLLPDLP